MIKFALVTQPRSGSFMLDSMLRSRDDVYCPIDVLNRHRPSMPMKEPSAAEAMRVVWETGEKQGVEAAGFLFHPSAARTGDWSADVYDALIADPKIKLVRMWRKNMLHMAVSLREAEVSGWWRVLPHDRDKADKARKPVRLDRTYLLDYFKQWEKERAAFNEKFKDREKLELWYDDDKPLAIGRKVQKYLGLKKDDTDLKPGYLKQRPDDRVAPRVSNYADVVRLLTGTPYEKWLDNVPKT